MFSIFNIFNKTKSRQPAEKQKILIFCGAGISQESGLSTFRDANGLWANHDINTVCNLQTFAKNKEAVFDFYNERKKEILQAQPNLAHYGVAQIQKKYGKDNVRIFTSNIDLLLTQAGCEDVVHVHGNILGMKCLRCATVWDIGLKPYELGAVCPHCAATDTKPSIIFFNEPAPEYQTLRAEFEKGGLIYKGDIISNIKLIIGTSFKVIKPDIFIPERGRTIVLDKNPPEVKDAGKRFEKIIVQPATQGITEVSQLIDSWYFKPE